MAEYNRAGNCKRAFFSRNLDFAQVVVACFFFVVAGGERLFAQEIEVRLTLRSMVRTNGNYLCSAFSPDGRILAFGGREWMGLWDLAGGKLQRKLTFQNGGAVDADFIAFSPNGKILAVVNYWIQLWDVTTGKMRKYLTSPNNSSIHSIAFAPDGKTLAASAKENALLWDMTTGKLRATLRHPSWVRTLAISPDGKILATSGFFKDIFLWHLDTGRPCGRLKERTMRARRGSPWHLTFTLDGKNLVAADESTPGDVNLWDLATGKATCIYSHRAGFEDVILSPDGRTLAFVDTSTIHLFDLFARQERASISVPGRHCGSLTFSPDGRTLAAGRRNGDVCVILFDLASVKGVKAPDAAELARLWKRLGSSDAPDAYRAIRILSAFPRQSVPFLRQEIRPLPPPTAAQLAAGARYVPDLDSDDFATRQKAYQELQKAGACVEDALRRALVGRPSPEMRKKAQALLGRITANRTARRLQHHRVLEVLEHMDDADARTLLADLAKDAPEALIRQEAKDSLARVRKRPPPTIIKPLPPEAPARPKPARPAPARP